jgi:phosphoribosylaminoimidazole carboxylase
MLKNRKLAYDGRGNAMVRSEAEAVTQFDKLSGVDLYAEKWVDYEKELAVMVVRSQEGIFTYPLVETVQEDSICRVVIVPANVPSSSEKEALEVARAAVASFTGLGVYGVELFLLRDGSVILNEVAPRCVMRQFYYFIIVLH